MTMTRGEVLDWLKRKGTRRTIEGMDRYGIEAKRVYGVPMGQLQSLSRKIGKNQELYLAALKNTIPMYSETGAMDPKGASAVLTVFSEGSPAVAKANIDVSKTYTNRFVEQANKAAGAGAK